MSFVNLFNNLNFLLRAPFIMIMLPLLRFPINGAWHHHLNKTVDLLNRIITAHSSPKGLGRRTAQLEWTTRNRQSLLI